MRKNNKNNVTNIENSIKKSNDFSLARLNAGLTLNQMQLLAFAIYSTQNTGLTTFNKYEFEDKFEVGNYKTSDAQSDSKKLFDLSFATVNLDEDEFTYVHVFQRIHYENGRFEFEWSNALLPHIIDLKNNFVLTDLTVTSKFKSSFSWTLYDFLKANYGAWHKTLSKLELMRLFNVEDRQTYIKNTSALKRTILDVAIAEINEHTEYECWYKEKKIGNKITHFTLHFSKGRNEVGATEKQLALLRNMYDSVMNDMLSFISLENDNLALQSRKLLQSVQEIDIEVKKGCLTTEKADIYIKNMKNYINQLETIKERDGKEEIYFNWLKDD